MELDNLKEAWKGHTVKNAADSNEQILSMLHKKSQRPIAKMKRNLFRELVTVIVLYTACILYYVISDGGKFWEVALMLFIIGVLFLFFYYRKNKLLNEMECVACEVKSNLQRQVSTLEKYVRFYFIAGTILTPLSYFTAGIILLNKTPGITLNTGFYMFFFGVGVVMTILLYFVNKWYVNKLYGQHVKKLKELLKQMEETTESHVVS
jgi:Ca2+/Na+ antiporter